jgi:D-beta-D-heptose 7-phosphate kinase/D-beta-D-heptose 1-phosphate adenosyltransferase
MAPKVVVVSGHIQCIHRGHIEMARLAREFAGPDGRLIFIVNSDHQSKLKKGYSFVPEGDRLAVAAELRCVDRAVLSIDRDRTVCATIDALCRDAEPGWRPTHFANGGDVTPQSPCPEEGVCRRNGIELVYGLGAKVQSTTDILETSVPVAYAAMAASIARATEAP